MQKLILCIYNGAGSFSEMVLFEHYSAELARLELIVSLSKLLERNPENLPEEFNFLSFTLPTSAYINSKTRLLYEDVVLQDTYYVFDLEEWFDFFKEELDKCRELSTE